MVSMQSLGFGKETERRAEKKICNDVYKMDGVL